MAPILLLRDQGPSLRGWSLPSSNWRWEKNEALTWIETAIATHRGYAPRGTPTVARIMQAWSSIWGWQWQYNLESNYTFLTIRIWLPILLCLYKREIISREIINLKKKLFRVRVPFSPCWVMSAPIELATTCTWLYLSAKSCQRKRIR